MEGQQAWSEPTPLRKPKADFGRQGVSKNIKELLSEEDRLKTLPPENVEFLPPDSEVPMLSSDLLEPLPDDDEDTLAKIPDENIESFN